MFSVIIPLYNKADYIAKAIQYVLNQSFSNFELIIVNDGSTDNSFDVLHQFSDPRIRIISQENAGVSTARNNGVKTAIYEYIAFLDADDWWDPAYLAEIHDLVRNYPDAAIWASKYYKVKQGRQIEARVGLEEDFSEGYINYCRVYAKTMWMPITSSSFIIKKSVFNDLGGYNTSLKFGEDFYLWSNIALKYKIAYLNTPLVYYNQDANQKNRAVGSLKIWPPENHFIFNLNHLEKLELTNSDIKELLDKLRLHSLFRYRLKKAHREEVQKILVRVDFTKQPLSWNLKYHSPLFLVRTWFQFKKWGSLAKTKLINLSL